MKTLEIIKDNECISSEALDEYAGSSVSGRISVCLMDPSNILIWNVRGLNGTARQDAVRTLVADSKIDVVCLQETKLADVTRILVLQMLGLISAILCSYRQLVLVVVFS
jgi:hypothetical protein